MTREKRERKDVVKFHISMETAAYKRLYNKCRKQGITVQDKLRYLAGIEIENEN